LFDYNINLKRFSQEPEYNKVCEGTDLYSIGAVIYSKIFGKKPDKNCPAPNLTELMNHPLFWGKKRSLHEAFKNFFDEEPQKRFNNSADTMLRVIAHIITIINEDRPIPEDRPVPPIITTVPPTHAIIDYSAIPLEEYYNEIINVLLKNQKESGAAYRPAIYFIVANF